MTRRAVRRAVGGRAHRPALHGQQTARKRCLGRIDICQPDITMVGTFTGIRRIAAAAAGLGVTLDWDFVNRHRHGGRA
jgi:hypothetical protein